MRIDKDEVAFDAASVLDPNGRLFRWRGELFRAVLEPSASLYRDLFKSGAISRLINSGLVETELTSLTLHGYDLILKHKTIPFRSYPYEWCPSMLMDAALLTCDLNIELNSLGLMTQDAHPWNILFEGSKPRYVDFSSIVPVRKTPQQIIAWFREFQSFFLDPLLLMAQGNVNLAHRYFFKSVNVADKGMILKALSPRNLFQRKLYDLQAMVLKHESFEALLKQLRRSLCNAKIQARPSHWSGYYDDEFPSFEPSASWHLKHTNLFKYFSDLQPSSVLDIGSNRGWYAELASRMGSKVVAFDIDEWCIESLYKTAREENLGILPLLIDFKEPSPPCTGVKHGDYFPPATERLNCDMVIALALVHHLVFKQGLRFAQIVEQLGQFVGRWLCVEFVPPDDQYVSKWMTPDFDWYSLDGFITELQKTYSEVIVSESFPQPRKLVLCKR